MQAPNFGDRFDQLSLWIFMQFSLKIFSTVLLLYHDVKKSKMAILSGLGHYINKR